MSARDLVPSKALDGEILPAEGHGGRAHSRIGPSAAHRWLACPGSVQRSEHIPNRSTVFAKEGTAAHEFCEFILRTGHEPNRFLHGAVNLAGKRPVERFLEKHTAGTIVIDRDVAFAIDEEMVEGAELYRDTIKSYHEDGDICLLEQRLDMSHIHPELFGTGDCLLFKPRTRHLIVFDFKYGRGVAVEVTDNEQLMTYGVGALRHFKNYGRLDRITLVLVQPRAFHHDGPVRTQEIDAIDLLMFEDSLRARAAEIDDPDAAICVGDQCKWCPISHACDELRTHVHQVTGARFVNGEITDSAMPDPKTMTPDQLGAVMRQVAVIEGWMRSVAQHAHDEALAGRIPTGMKIVEKRAYRHWVGTEEDLAVVFDLYGLNESDYMTDPQPEMKSPAQVEKAIGKKNFKELFEGDVPVVRKKSSGFVLALIEDRRPEVKMDRTELFGSVIDDE